MFLKNTLWQLKGLRCSSNFISNKKNHENTQLYNTFTVVNTQHVLCQWLPEKSRGLSMYSKTIKFSTIFMGTYSFYALRMRKKNKGLVVLDTDAKSSWRTYLWLKHTWLVIQTILSRDYIILVLCMAVKTKSVSRLNSDIPWHGMSLLYVIDGTSLIFCSAVDRINDKLLFNGWSDMIMTSIA